MDETIKEIQRLLAVARIDFVGDPTGVLDLKTQMALREFQRFAKLGQLAKEDVSSAKPYVERLTAARNPSPYTGPMDGVPNEETVRLLKLWADPAQNLRCPVVIQAWTIRKNSVTPPPCGQSKVPHTAIEGFDNLWLHDQIEDTDPRVFVFDFSGHYFGVPIGDRPEKIVLGTFLPFKKAGGPTALAPHHVFVGHPSDPTKPGAEMVPLLLVGEQLGNLTDPQRSTFKVVRAVGEAEAFGYFDSYNANDDGTVSLGPCHWTLGLKNLLHEAELPAYLAYLKASKPASFARTIGMWGVGALDDWGTNGATLFRPKLRIFVSTFGHQKTDLGLERVPDDAAKFYRSWHWVYRFQAAARFDSDFRRQMWDMTRFRIRDILAAPFDPFKDSPLPNGTKIGDVFTSERAVALLLRWHVKAPSHVINPLNGSASAKLNAAVLLANKPKLTGPPANWPKDVETRLIGGLLAKIEPAVSKEVYKTFKEVNAWPTWKKYNPFCFRLARTIPALDAARKSFNFEKPALAAPSAASETRETAERAAGAETSAGAAVTGALRVVLIGLAGKTLAYTVKSDGFTLTESGSTAGVDRIVLFNANVEAEGDDADAVPPPLITLPIIRDGVSKLRVDRPGQLDSTLEVDVEVRCWLPHEARQTEDVKFEVTHKPDVGERRTLVFSKLSFGAMSETTKKPVDPELGALGVRTFAERQPTRFPQPLPALTVGVVFKTEQNRPQERTLRFNQPANAAVAGACGDALLSVSSVTAAAPLALEFESVFDITGPQAAKPYPIAFAESEMPLAGAVRTILLRARQPHGRPWREAVHSEWIFECVIPERAALEAWNDEVVAPVTTAIDIVQKGRPTSVLPRFVDPKASVQRFWLARYSVIDKVAKATVPPGSVKIQMPGTQTPKDRVGIFARVLTPFERDNTPRSIVDVSVPRLRRATGDPREPEDPLFCRLELYARDDEREEARAGAIRFGVLQIKPDKQVEHPVPQRVRMGALDLDFPSENAPVGGGADLGLSQDVERESRLTATFGVSGSRLRGATEREVTYSVKVLAIRPGGQDDVPGSDLTLDLGATLASTDAYTRTFRRAAPLLIGASGDTPQPSPFFLTVREIIERDRSQSISLRLRSVNDTGRVFSGASVYVIDPEPFLIAHVRVENVDSGLAITTEIGNWSTRAGEGTGWELNAGASGFDLALPPQGLGEEMHRRIGAGDVTPGTPADFRFTPPTVASLQASFFRQRFAEAPWNLRRILGFAGQRAPGASIDRVRFELLYGMPGTIAARSLRLAEIGSLLGRNAGQQPPQLTWRFSGDQCRQYVAARETWRRIYGLLQTRLGVLQAYDPNRPDALVLRDADGLSFELRKGAHLRFPVSLPPDVKELGDIPTVGIAGSFSWAFESRNIYEALWRKRQADTAQLWQPFFSALGGWGQQKGTFDNRRSAVFSDVSMGRVGTINVERIGRIGVYWNRARHVIVYERTVAPSRQFFLEQEPFHGNPLLRKVEEYIEILEEERAFPDSNADPITRGPILACSFPGGKPPRIHVNSRWGEDIGTTGWKIPLWVRGAAPVDVYPKPAVHLICAGADPAERIPVAIDEPEKLFFYTNTDPAFGDDTNHWPPVPGLDVGIVATKEALKPPVPSAATSDPATFEVRDKFVPAGLRSFTTALGAGAKPVDVVAERGTEAIASALQNVTVTRGLIEQPLGQLDAVAELLETLANAVAPALAGIPANAERFPHDLKTFFTDARFGDIRGSLERLRAAANTLITEVIADAAEIAQLAARIRAQAGFAGGELRREIDMLFWRLYDDFRAITAPLENQTDFRRVRDDLRRQFLELVEGGEVFDGYAALLDRVPGSVGESIRRFEALLDHIGDATDGLIAKIFGAAVELSEIPEWVKQTPPPAVIALLERHEADVAAGLRELEFIIGEPSRQWVGNALDVVRLAVRPTLARVETLARELRYEALSNVGLAKADALQRLEQLQAEAGNARDETAAAIQTAIDKLIALDPGGLAALARTFASAVLEPAFNVDTWPEFVAIRERAFNTFTVQLAEGPDRAAELAAAAAAKAAEIRAAIFPQADALIAALEKSASGQAVDAIVDRLAKIVSLRNADVRVELERFYDALRRDLDELTNRLRLTLKLPDLSKLPSIGLNTLRLLRAFGDPPRVPQLDFRLPDCGYYFFDLRNGLDFPSVKLSALAARANQLGEKLLNAIEITLPTTELLDRLTPDKLQNYDLSKLFPNFAGLQLGSLFPSLRAPALANDHVRVMHGVDPQSRTGWLQLDVDVPVTEPVTVFSVAGVTFRLLTARFEAVSRIETTAGQTPRQTSRGSITGDWDLQIGGLPIAILTSCALTFDNDGKIGFTVSPDRVKLQQVLAFLADLMSTFNYGDRGFSIAVTPEGIRTVLDLPLPDVQAGAFGLANLRLGFVFALNVFPFQITAGLSVARKTSPFTLTIFVLGGAGYLDMGVRYRPQSGEFDTFVNIGIMASASLAIALGPVRGGVYAYFGVTVDYASSTNRPSRLAIGLLLMFAGEVSVLGIITVGLRLGLEAQYTNGGGLRGRGFVSLSIKICWFVTINVNAAVEYTFGGASSSRAALAEGAPAAEVLALASSALYDAAADAYIEMFA